MNAPDTTLKKCAGCSRRTTSPLWKCPRTSTPSDASSSAFSTRYISPPSWRRCSIYFIFRIFSMPRCGSASPTASASRSAMRIELCIPAFNEERVIAEAARAVLRVLRRLGKEVAVTVVDNASTDGTADIAKGIEGVSVVSIPVRGKGAAVIAAARRSEADMFGFLDADLSVDPEEIPALLPLLERSECDIVIGSRLIDGGIVNRGKFRTFSSRVFNMIRKMLVGGGGKDTQGGL